MATFFFHDYETFGIDPALDRPSQFAGIRTDEDFNEIGKPLELFCRPPADYLPSPEACLITRITPQRAHQYGVNEAEFINQVLAAFSQPQTCAVGYNSIRFDDEVTRFTLYRNFHDPYAREYKNGNSRWDLIDVVRACYALRPDGIEWPQHDDGTPSFKLEHLTAANGLSHEKAHDAVSDVRATIALARLVKTHQPRLLNYLLNLRNKHKAREALKLGSGQPVTHISSKFPALQGCASWVLPVAEHPTNTNAVLAVDLNTDPQPLLDLSVEELRAILFTPRAQQPADAPVIGIKGIHCNKCPVIAPAGSLSAERADELGLDRQACRRHLDLLLAHPELTAKIQQIFSEPGYSEHQDPEQMLYSGGFFSAHDRALMQEIHQRSPMSLTDWVPDFQDQRLPELFFRYRARNWPESLNEAELRKWQAHCEQIITPARVDDYRIRLQQLAAERPDDSGRIKLLQQLDDYVSGSW